MTKDEIYDLFFEHQVKSMLSGIEATIEKAQTLHTCALALSTYTEVMGGLVTGNLRKERKSKENYDGFLEYMGMKYVDLNNELQKYFILTDDGKKKPATLYRIIRSKLVHEFALRESYFIMTQKKPSEDKIGIEVKFSNNKIIHTNFFVREYYRDFKNGLAKYYNDLGLSARQPPLSEGQNLFKNFMMAIRQSNIIK